MSKGQFYNFPTPEGSKMANINNIALIEDLNPSVKITLNVKNVKGEFISFVANLPYGYVTGQILVMDEAQQ